MKIAITVRGAGLGAWLDPNFSECLQVMFVDKNNHFEAWVNPRDGDVKKRALVVAQKIIGENVDVLVCGVPPKDVLSIFQQAGIMVIIKEKGTVFDLIEMARILN